MKKTACLGAHLLLIFTGLAAADDLSTEIFEGQYFGQGRGCGGLLTIRPGGIFWHSQALSCEITQYEASELEHEGYRHQVIYEVKKKNKSCRLYAIKLGHDEYFPSYMGGWYISGYFTKQEFDNRQDPASASYACVLIKDYNPRNNPEPKDLPTP